jgi:hypothetical protein
MAAIETKVVQKPEAKITLPSKVCCFVHAKGRNIAHYRCRDDSNLVLLDTTYSDTTINSMIAETGEECIYVIMKCSAKGCASNSELFTVAQVISVDYQSTMTCACYSVFCRSVYLTYLFKPDEWTFVGNFTD